MRPRPEILTEYWSRKAFLSGVWSIHDDGDIPPRWKLGGPGSIMKKPRGIALNPKDKELIIADMRLNSVLTYYFPEIFLILLVQHSG